jgi:hypothetical protein
MTKDFLLEHAVVLMPKWLPFYKIYSVVDTFVGLRDAGADLTEARVANITRDLSMEGIGDIDIAALTVLLCENRTA